jgi:polysaccharide chain length determinant protein (PEP-CTERM system associated)
VLPGRKYKVDDILRLLWRRKWLVILPLVICTAATYVVARRMPDQYRSETTILVVPPRVPEAYVRSTVSGRIEDRLQSLQQQILSRSRLERIVLDFNLYRAVRQTQPLENVIKTMRAAIKVDTVRGGEAFTVIYTGTEPRTVQAVTERLASLFIEENIRDRELLAIGTSDFLQTQLDDARKKLVEQEKKLEQYRLRYAGQLPSQAPANLQAIQSLRLQLQALDDGLARARDRQLTLERQLAELVAPDASVRAAAPAAGPADDSEVSGATAREQLDNARQRLANLEARLTPAHPDIARLKRTVAQLEQKLAVEAASAPPGSARESLRERRVRDLRADLDTLVGEIAARATEQRRIRDEMARYQSHLDAAPIREAELTELTRDSDTMQQIYRTLLGKREDSKVAANLEQRQVGEQFRVLDPARVPERPFSPDRSRINLLGAAFGLLIGLGASALLEYLDNTLKSEEDVRLVLGLPVIATIPVLGVPETAR